MAKKKAETEVLTGDIDYIELAIQNINKKMEINVFESGKSILEENRITIPVSPSIDDVCGGFTEGTCVSLLGPEKVGKTTMALCCAANAQKPEYGSRPIFILDVEERFMDRNLEGIEGLDPTKVQVIRSKKGKLLSHIDYMNIGLDLLSTIPYAFVIADSLSALFDRTDAEGIAKEDRGAANKPLSRFINALSAPVRVNKCIFVGVTHNIANTGWGGGGPVEKTAKRWLYQTDTKLKCNHWEWWKDGEDKIGKIVKWEALHSIGAPGRVSESYLRFGIGLDKVRELAELCVNKGMIEKGGAWYTYGERKFQGMENLCDFIRGNQEVNAELCSKLKGLTVKNTTGE